MPAAPPIPLRCWNARPSRSLFRWPRPVPAATPQTRSLARHLELIQIALGRAAWGGVGGKGLLLAVIATYDLCNRGPGLPEGH